MRANGDGRDRRLALALTGILAVAVALLLGRALLGGDALIGADQMLLREPWRAELLPRDASISTAPAGDTFDIWDPQRQIFADALLDGDMALWNPYPSGGAPLAAEPSTGTYSPFQLTYLALPDWYAPGVVKLLEIAACVGFTFLFLRSVGLSRVAGLTAGLVYAFNGFQLVWTNWPQTRVGALVPALFWAVERVLQRRDRASAALTAVVAAVLILDGFPTVMLAALIAAGAYVVVRGAAAPDVRSASRQWVRAGGLSAAGIGLGIGLAAVQLLPFLARLPLLELSRDQTPDAHFDALVAATLVAPNTFGAPQEGAFHLPGNYVESLAYVGAAACVLVVVALARRAPAGLVPGVRLHATLTALVAFVLMFVGGPLLELAQQFPPLDTNNVGRLRALLAFALAVLAGIGMETVVARRPTTAPDAGDAAPGAAEAAGAAGATGAAEGARPGRPGLAGLTGLVTAWLGSRRVQWALRAALVAGTALVATGGALHVLRTASDRAYLSDARQEVAVAGLIAGAAIVAVVVAWRWPRLTTPAVVALGLLVVGQGVAVWQPYLPFSERDEWFARTGMHDFLEENQGHERTATADSTLVAGSAARYGIRTVTGHVFTQPTWRDLLKAIDPAAFSRSPTLSYLASTAEVADSPVLDRLGARYFATGEDAEVLGVASPPPAGGPATDAGVGAGDDVVLGPGESATGAVRARRLRAVSLTLTEALTSDDALAWLRVTVRDEDGTVVARGSRRVHGALRAGTHTVAVAAESATSAAPTDLAVEVALDADDGRAVLAADAGGRPALGTVVGDDDLELVFSDHGQVYRRSTALPRVRWASRARVERDDAQRIALLRSGLPDDTVVLDEPGPELDDTVTGELTGGGADVDVTADGLDGVRVAVDAQRPGYLVLADAVQIGWQVRIDGEPAELRHADHALGAVHVPAGRHTVEFAFRPERLGLGRVVSLLSLLVLLGLVLGPVAARRLRRSRPPAGDGDEGAAGGGSRDGGAGEAGGDGGGEDASADEPVDEPARTAGDRP